MDEWEINAFPIETASQGPIHRFLNVLFCFFNFKVYGQDTQDGCSLYIPCSTSACFTYTLLTCLTFLHPCPRLQLMTVLALDQNISTLIAYQRGSEEQPAPLLVSLVTNEPT